MSLKAVSQIKLERPGLLASMADNLIAIAMEDGSISLYNLKDSATRKFIEEPKKIATLSVPAKVVGTSAPTMSTTLSSAGVEKRSFPLPRQAIAMDLTANGPPTSSSGTSSQRLMAQFQDAIYVWDTSRTDAPIQMLKTSVATTRSLRWCPLASSHSHISRGSLSGTVKIYDLKARDPNVPVWNVKKAHVGAIRDLTWNPFIPYWFATAGSDSVIQIWDTRFGGKPVRTLTDHSNSVNSVSWSPTNVDILASGGADRRFKLWNLRAEPHCVISTLGLWDSSVQNVGWVRTRPNPPVFAVSATGIVQACLPTPEFMLPMVPSLGGPQKDAIKQVERAIYTRNFATGFQRAYQLAQQFLAENRISQANKLLNICYQRPDVTEPAFPKPPPPSLSSTATASSVSVLTTQSTSTTNLLTVKSSASAPLSQMAQTASMLSLNEAPPKLPPPELKATITKDQFEQDLLFYSYYIPPNYPDHLWPVVDQKLMFSIEALKMSIDLEQLIRDEDSTELVKIQPDVADFMKRDPASMDIQLLFRLFAVLLPADFLSSLELGYQLARVFTRNTTSFYGIANMLMFPMLYDTNMNREAVYGDILSLSSGGVNGGANGMTPTKKGGDVSSTSPQVQQQQQQGGGSSLPVPPVDHTPSGSSVTSGVTSGTATPGNPNNSSSASTSGMLSHKLYVGIQNAASALNTEITSSFLSDQLEFQYKFYKTLWGNNPKDVLDIFDSNTVCLSSTTWRIYLNMLTLYRQYDKLFIRGSRLGERVKGFPFAEILNQLMSDVVPRLQKYLRDATSLGMSISGASGSSRNMRDMVETSDSNESESVQAVNRLGRASGMVLNILHNSDPRYLPKTLVATLPGSLHQLTVDLETSIREVVDEDNSLDDPDKLTRISAALKTISTNLTSIIGKREPAGQFMEPIYEFRAMIDNNVRLYGSGASSSTPTGAPASSYKKPLGARGRLASLTSADSPRAKKDLPSPDPKK